MNLDPKDLLFPYVNGELNEKEARQVEERCGNDPELAEELAFTKSIVRLIAAHRPIENRPFFWTRLAARLDAVEASRQAWIWVAKRLVPSMVAVTLLVTGALWYQQPAVDENGYDDMLAYTLQDDWLTQTGEISKESILESAVFSEQR
ncbi:MAG: hypothetical protein VYA69_07470 [Gemmatimonadota bacterium]|nr:hypothetical protein [Gemmatimonadota bacterium]